MYEGSSVLCKSTWSFFLSFITGLGQDFSCEEKEHTTVSREIKYKALNINYH